MTNSGSNEEITSSRINQCTSSKLVVQVLHQRTHVLHLIQGSKERDHLKLYKSMHQLLTGSTSHGQHGISHTQISLRSVRVAKLFTSVKEAAFCTRSSNMTMISTLFLVMFMIHSVSSPVSAVLQGAVIIHNEMRDHQAIHADCERFGAKTIVYGDPFQWGFRHGGRGSSQGAYIRCGFTSGRKVQKFIVWAGDGVQVPYEKCERCLWRVGAGGFYVNEAGLPANAAVFVYPWLPHGA